MIRVKDSLPGEAKSMAKGLTTVRGMGSPRKIARRGRRVTKDISMGEVMSTGT